MTPRFLLLLLVVMLLPCTAILAKPPTPAKPAASPTPAPSGTVAESGNSSLLRWLLLQNGGPAAAAIPWPEIVRMVSGRQVTPFDPASEPDASTLANLTTALDGALPRLNRPEGPLRVTPTLTNGETVARIADDLRTALAVHPGSTAELSASSTHPDALCPVLRWSEGSNRRPCHLLVATYPAGGKDTVLRTLTVRAADLAGQITSDGPCLLVGIEHNGKPGRDLALLNWEVIDLARLSLRCALTFEADSDVIHAPGSAVADGRRGRD